MLTIENIKNYTLDKNSREIFNNIINDILSRSDSDFPTGYLLDYGYDPEYSTLEVTIQYRGEFWFRWEEYTTSIFLFEVVRELNSKKYKYKV